VIPLFATRAALEPLLGEIVARQRAVVESGRYILGPEVEAFEEAFASYLERRHCIGVANGTDALTIALRALGVQPDDEIIVPALSFFATAEAVVNAGAVPVFADIDPLTHCMTADTAAAAIGDHTKAIVPVHLFGNVAPMGELNELAAEHGLMVLEDAAQAAGASLSGRKAGSWGTAAAFSFYPSKNLGALGDAGAIVTDDDEVAAAARRLRNHGTVDRWIHTEAAYNSRLDELQAAALSVMLSHLDRWTRLRRRVARHYREFGLGEVVTLPRETAGAEAAYHLFVVSTRQRDRLVAELADSGIEARPYFTTALHRQPAMAAYGSPLRLPGAETVAASGVALPMGPALATDAVRRVVSEVRRILGDSREDQAEISWRPADARRRETS
jgi:dTDP-3-amino-3,4,6-trideoxy-alpha-D-glucose transaminase